MALNECGEKTLYNGKRFQWLRDSKAKGNYGKKNVLSISPIRQKDIILVQSTKGRSSVNQKEKMINRIGARTLSCTSLQCTWDCINSRWNRINNRALARNSQWLFLSYNCMGGSKSARLRDPALITYVNRHGMEFRHSNPFYKLIWMKISFLSYW